MQVFNLPRPISSYIYLYIQLKYITAIVINFLTAAYKMFWGNSICLIRVVKSNPLKCFPKNYFSVIFVSPTF